MNRLIFLFLLCLVSVSSQALESPKFWQKIKDWEKKIDLEREIYVSVNSVSAEESKPASLQLDGTGAISAPFDFVWNESKKFDQLSKISEHFKKSTWDPVRRELFMHIEAMGFETQMTMKIEEEELANGGNFHFRVIDGKFMGLKGKMEYKDFKRMKTQATMDVFYSAQEMPLPKFLMGVALEVVAERVASRMRSFLEDQYQASLKKKK